MELNESTYTLVKNSFRRVNRLRLLRLHSKLYCGVCQKARRVTDFFSGIDVAALECGHRRPIFNRTPEEITAYEAEKARREARQELVGFCQPTAGGHVHRFEEEAA